MVSSVAPQGKRPDVAVSSNIPLLALFPITSALRIREIPYVIWWHGVYSDAIGALARDRRGRLGDLAGRLASRFGGEPGAQP
jgi:hypothetical protein